MDQWPQQWDKENGIHTETQFSDSGEWFGFDYLIIKKISLSTAVYSSNELLVLS